MTNPQPTQPPTVLIAAKTEAGEQLAAALGESYQVVHASSAHAGETVLAAGEVALIICAAELDDMPGLTWLCQLYRRRVPGRRIFVAAESTEQLAITAINEAGVAYYLTPASGFDGLEPIVATVLRGHGDRRLQPDRPAGGNRRQSDALPLVQQRFVARLSHIVGLSHLSLMSVLFISLFALLLGSTVLLFLYMLKCALGIDLIPGFHLGDWLRPANRP